MVEISLSGRAARNHPEIPGIYRQDSREGKEWSIVYDCRAVLAVLPSNSGHIHPDENFQSIEVNNFSRSDYPLLPPHPLR